MRDAVAAEEVGERLDHRLPEPDGRPTVASRGNRDPRLGGEQDGHHADAEAAGHGGIGPEPAGELGDDQRAGTGEQHRDAVADHHHGGAGALLPLLEQFDAVGVDHDVLARRQEGNEHREQRHAAEIGLWVAGAQAEDSERQQHLHEQEPATPAAEQRGERWQRHPIHDRRPGELPGIGQADEREQADGRLVDLGLGQPEGQRGQGQQQRQSAREAEQQHHEDPRLQIDLGRAQPGPQHERLRR